MTTDTRPQHLAARGRQSILAGLVVNILLAATKTVAGLLGHSYALVADGIESAADVFSSVIVWSGLRIAAAPRDASHPYGHGKAEPLAAMVVALLLLGAAVWIAVQSLREIRDPHQAPALFTLPVLVGVVIIKELMFRYIVTVGQDIESLAVKTDAWHHRSDALTSAAAFVGISIALLGGPGYESADDWAALLASAVIAYNGYRLFMPALHEVMDAAPQSHVEAEIRRSAAQVLQVAAIEKCFVRKMGFEYYVDIHVEVDGSLTVREGHEIAHQVKEAIRRAHPRVADVLVHIEPEGIEHEQRGA
ncbi:MAG TPA: cation diffusion facilitator family transporter [Phycisphaerae bacterium]|nr:cation transporter [Phycisphaerae bacterium]HOB73370.1 cation diffusion facilitator family transporter [Phycisphaerae bacterium]HOJ55195.1 cation diffusion facilitator family transporter [Phycisphaerae bacterium]HOL25012.1 cation diffusion facilitator family transporter [Phycisphaerae bacterium]HPP20114.1 cation diffusion facilitator family transporter [Phycisphaerae bacterium]